MPPFKAREEITVTIMPCPFPGCDIFPYDDASDLVSHINLVHVPVASKATLTAAFVPAPAGTDAVPTASGRFRTEANGFGGTTTVKAPTHPDVPVDADLDAVNAFVLERFSGRKLEITDMTSNLHAYAEGWLAAYEGNFEFLLDVAQDLATKGRLSLGQAKGVLNCIRADALRTAKAQAPAEPVAGFDLRTLPESAHGVLHVAVPDHASGDLIFLNIHQRRQGKVIVTQLVGGNDDLYLGTQPHGHIYTGKRTAELEAVLADPQAAVKAYGDNFTRCGICNTPLSLQESLDRGMGAKCAAKAGW